MIPVARRPLRRPIAWALLAIGLGTAAPAAGEVAASDPWAMQSAILQRIVPPKFPKREFPITKFGAIADGTTTNTAALHAAIAACARAGGGRVVVPAGRYLTGPIHLRSGVNLHLAEGAEIIFSDQFEDYLPVVLVRVGGVELYNYSPLIYARDCTNIAITGAGKLNGNAARWWEWRKRETKRVFEVGRNDVPVAERVFGKPEDGIRPSFLCLVSCTNVLLEDFTIGSGPNWTIHPVYCQNLTVRSVQVVTDGPNNDGMDPDSCRDVLIENCTFDTGDDCVVLKSGYNEDGWRVGRPTENVIMRNCFSKRGHGGLVVGSEMSGGVRNVFMEDCQFEGTDRAIRIKSRADRGGVVEDIHARNLQVKNMQREVVILNMDYGSDRNQPVNTRPPVFRNMKFENITVAGAPTAILIQGLADSPIENIHFANLTISSTKGVTANFVKGLRFDHVQITPSEGPAFTLTDAADITFTNCDAAKGVDLFLQIGGRTSRAITLNRCDLSQATKPFLIGADIPAEELHIK